MVVALFAFPGTRTWTSTSSSFTGAVAARVRLVLCVRAGASGCPIESRGSSASSSASALRVLAREGAGVVVVTAFDFGTGRARVLEGSDRATGTGVARLRVARVLETYGGEIIYDVEIEKGRIKYRIHMVSLHFSGSRCCDCTSPRLGASRAYSRLGIGGARPRLDTRFSRLWCSSRLFVLNIHMTISSPRDPS